jgi:hypothetical protein
MAKKNRGYYVKKPPPLKGRARAAGREVGCPISALMMPFYLVKFAVNKIFGH